MVITIEISPAEKAKVIIDAPVIVRPPDKQKETFIDVFNLYPHLHPYYRNED